MSNHLPQTVQNLRDKLLSGIYQAGSKLPEETVAKSFGVSRTVIRLALAELEREGLVYRQPNRGYWVSSYSMGDVTEAIQVRGELEGMAARLCAQKGLKTEEIETLQQILDQLDELMHSGDLLREETGLQARMKWIELNSKFHDCIIFAAKNNALVDTISSLSSIPLVSSQAIVFDPHDQNDNVSRLRQAQSDHWAVFDAIKNREGSRAEYIMKEHAFKSAANKRQSFDSIMKDQQEPKLVGLALIKGGL